MISNVDRIFQPKQIGQSQKNDYLNDRLNAQRVLAVISLFVPFTLFFIYLIAPHASDSGSALILKSISMTVISTAIIRLIANWRKPREDFYQLICAAFDFIGIGAILIGYAYTYDVPISVALKSPTANIFFVFLTSRVVLLNGPILLKTCGIAVAVWAALTCLAMIEPDFTGRTNSYVEYLTSFKVLLGAEVERALQFTIISAILYTFIFLVRHDPGTGYLRRPVFLQSVDKFLSHAKRKHHKSSYALVELRVMSLVHVDKTYDTVFSLVSDLPALKPIRVIEIGRLSNRNMAIWISYPKDQIVLDVFIDQLSNELSRAAILSLGSQAPAVFIGGTLFNYKVSSEEQFTYTDIAIKNARANGQRTRVFDTEMKEKIAYENYVKQAIRYGLNHHLFSVNYQPIIDLMTDRPIGFEALIRLIDRQGENIPPSVFIPIAEETGLITEITDQLCSIVANEAPIIRNAFLAEKSMPYININISPQQLNDIDRTLLALKCAQVGGLKINVEITESSVLNKTETFQQIELLRQCGFSLVIDDFGTGHSSIHRLETLNVSTLKIDGCFIKNIEDGNGYAFLKAIVDLSLTTSDSVIIEGVETLPQKLLLMKMGVRFCQGYFLARPMGVNRLEDHLFQTYGMKKLPESRMGRGGWV